MTNRGKVLKGLECCSAMSGEKCRECPYCDECRGTDLPYGMSHLSADALELLKEQDKLLHKLQKDKDKLFLEVSEWRQKYHDRPLKEQEAKYPVCEKCGKEIDHINTSVFNYDGSDSDYSIPITYRKENGCVSFSTSQNWTGYDLTDEERKEGICCPYCGKFPFDDSIEIEFYEPVEVLMWTSEGGEVNES